MGTLNVDFRQEYIQGSLKDTIFFFNLVFSTIFWKKTFFDDFFSVCE